jgi:ABC-type transporter Mla subunit MlaD
MTDVEMILLIIPFLMACLFSILRMRQDALALAELRERCGTPGARRPLPAEIDELLEDRCERFGDDRWSCAGGAEVIADDLVASRTQGKAWLAGPYFSAVALVLTFSLIASAVSSIEFTGQSDALKLSIQEAAGQIGAKFLISAVGLACALVHAVARSHFMGSVERAARAIAKELRLRVMSTADANVAVILTAMEEQRAATRAVVDGTSRVLASLQAQLDKQDASVRLLSQLDQHADKLTLQQGDAFGEISDSLRVLRDQFTGEQIDRALGMIREVFGSELEAKLRPLQLEMQGQRNEELLNTLSQRLHSAITGGASDVTREFNVSLQHIAKTLPDMLERMEASTTSFRNETREALGDLRKGVTDEMAALDTARGELEKSLRKTLGEVYAFSERVISASEGASLKTIESVTAAADKTIDAQSKFLEHVSRERKEELASHLTAAQAVADVIAGHIHQLGQVAQTSGVIVETAQKQRSELEGLVKSLGDAGQQVDRRQAELTDAAEGIRAAIEELAQHIDDQVVQFVSGAQRAEDLMREASRVDGTLRSIVTQVKDVLTQDLERAQNQVKAEQQMIEKLLQSVDRSLVAGLGSSVGELTKTVESLEQVVDRYRRAAAVPPTGATT